MKAVILERKGEDAAVLAENGTFMKVHRPGEVGEEIDIAPNVTPMPGLKQRWLRGLAAAALVLVAAGGAYHYTAVSVSAYVSVDAGGSSIEFTVNRLGKVTSVVSVSDADSDLAESLSGSVNGMSVEDAVTSALDTLTEKGALSPQEDLVIVGITSGSDSQAESLETAIVNNAGHSLYTVRVSDKEREEAHKQELGGGLYVYGHDDTDTAFAGYEDDETDTAEDITVAASVTTTTTTTITSTTTTTVSESVSADSSETEAEDQAVIAEASDADTLQPITGTAGNDQSYEIIHSSQSEHDARVQINESSDDSTRPPQPGAQISGDNPDNDQYNRQDDHGEGTAPAGNENSPQQSEQTFAGGNPPDQHGEQNGQAGSSQMPGGGEIPQQIGQSSDEMPPDQQNMHDVQVGQNEGASRPDSSSVSPQEQAGDMPGAGTQPPVSYSADRAETPDQMTPPTMSIAAGELFDRPIYR